MRLAESVGTIHDKCHNRDQYRACIALFGVGHASCAYAMSPRFSAFVNNQEMVVESMIKIDKFYG